MSPKEFFKKSIGFAGNCFSLEEAQKFVFSLEECGCNVSVDNIYDEPWRIKQGGIYADLLYVTLPKNLKNRNKAKRLIRKSNPDECWETGQPYRDLKQATKTLRLWWD